MKIKKLSSVLLHSNPRFDVIKSIYSIDDGKKYPYYTIKEKDGFVVILGIDNDKIMITKQYRIPVGKFSYEFVGGYIEENELPEDAAKREFLEESGYSCREVKKIGEIKSAVNKTNTTGHIFVASGFEKQEKHLDEFEAVIGLQSGWSKLEKVPEAIRGGFIFDATTLAAWAIYKETL